MQLKLQEARNLVKQRSEHEYTKKMELLDLQHELKKQEINLAKKKILLKEVEIDAEISQLDDDGEDEADNESGNKHGGVIDKLVRSAIANIGRKGKAGQDREADSETARESRRLIEE